MPGASSLLDFVHVQPQPILVQLHEQRVRDQCPVCTEFDHDECIWYKKMAAHVGVQCARMAVLHPGDKDAIPTCMREPHC